MSKGLYVRRVYKLDMCEWGKGKRAGKYLCKLAAQEVVQSPKKGVIWKLCNKHKKEMLKAKGFQCNNCGCFSKGEKADLT